MKRAVNQRQRFAKCRAHTATHLLHAELQKIIPDTKQEWSFVWDDELRFDFSSNELLDQTQLWIIQYNVNSAINWWFQVETFETTFDKAKELWAKAFFQDKYGDIVRVVKIWRYDEYGEIIKSDYSVELCGWTHVINTKEIGGFVIVSQSAVATWVKRITAYTWSKLIDYIKEKQTLIDWLCIKFDTHEKQLDDKVEKSLKHAMYCENTLKLLNTDLLTHIVSWSKQLQWYFVIDTRNFPSLHTQVLSALVISLKEVKKNILIVSDVWAYAIVSCDNTAKSFAQSVWLKWWWQDSLFQGKDEKVNQLIFEL